jgi:2-keto-3-deoxy-L-rhamnonate aldolase RhmA
MLRAHGAKPPIGTWVMSASPIVAEAVGSAGFEWGVIDMEHTPLDLMDLVHLLQAVGNTKMLPVVRVPWNDPVHVKRVLDAGAQTLMFPFVAKRRRGAARRRGHALPAAGVRGMAGMSRASRYGTTPDYLRKRQPERGRGAAARDAAGHRRAGSALPPCPAWTPCSWARPTCPAPWACRARLMHSDVLALMADAALRAKALGMPIGTLGGNPEEVTRYRTAGYSYVGVCSDLGLLMRGAQAALQALRHREGMAHVHTLAEGTRTEANA